jgi:hypothetical protein
LCGRCSRLHHIIYVPKLWDFSKRFWNKKYVYLCRLGYCYPWLLWVVLLQWKGLCASWKASHSIKYHRTLQLFILKFFNPETIIRATTTAVITMLRKMFNEIHCKNGNDCLTHRNYYNNRPVCFKRILHTNDFIHTSTVYSSKRNLL